MQMLYAAPQFSQDQIQLSFDIMMSDMKAS